jgi:hypothetical protein
MIFFTALPIPENVNASAYLIEPSDPGEQYGGFIVHSYSGSREIRGLVKDDGGT